MPSSTHIPLPNNIALDPDFRIDIVEPRTGAVGMRISQVVDVEGFRATFRPRRSQTERDVLRSPTLWSTFMRVQLGGRMSQSIQGLYTARGDLVPSAGQLPHVLHAFIPGGPRYTDPQSSLTIPAPYTTLHDILADILACQAVWYVKVLRGNREAAERASERPGADGDVWKVWRWACRHPGVDFLDTLYIVSIRRMRVSNTWAYFPEVEIRSPPVSG
ncbi:hypothetical protein V8D89_001791 [Ganoderma adspersum]